MKFTIACTITIVFLCSICNAQSASHPNNNAVSFELGKSGLLFNLSFDHKFLTKNYGLRATIGSNFATYLPAFTTGVGGYYLVGDQNNHLELGLDLAYLSVEETSDDQRGVILFYPDYPVETFHASANVGFRHYGKRTLFRVGVAPGIFKDGLLWGGYLGLGVRF